MYLVYKFTSVADMVTDENGKQVPVIHCIKCMDFAEAQSVLTNRVANFSGKPELIGYMSSIQYLDYNEYAPVLDDDLTK